MTVRHEVELWNRALARVGEVRLTPDASKAITGATAANPVVITAVAHGYSTGFLVLLRAVGGMTQINNRVFEIVRLGVDTFSLVDEDGTAHTAYTSGGGAYNVPRNKPASVCFDAWSKVRDAEIRSHPWNSVTKRTRLARLQASETITAATAANPVVITIGANDYNSGDQILIENVGGMVELNDRWFTVTEVTATTFQLAGEDGTLHTAYTTGGTTKKALPPLVPDFGYEARYTMPADCDRVLGHLLEDTTPWEVEGREVLIDGGDLTVPIRYIKRLLDVSQYDPALLSVLAARMAVEIAEELTSSKSKRELLLTEYDRIRSQATSVDGQEQAPEPHIEDDWLLSRF